MGPPTLPSALTRFTSEFGMGSGGAMSLLSLDKKGTILKAVSMRPCLNDDKYVDVHGCTNVVVAWMPRNDDFQIFIQFFMYVSFFRMLVKLTYKTTWVLYG